ncbi:hypothetical protein CK203_088102 [Vitis vinifera]|uniref:Uncharacterized protein n=1 Tax=Vitis vinifera TaxID=29760 RepID=A0A438F6J0_VITVI|nr:hypothetical protein CK203_088102 [Vitis vinifera]
MEVPPSKCSSTEDISERVKRAVAEVLLVLYYFLAGRLYFTMKVKGNEVQMWGIVTNHGVLDGRSAVEMLQNLASICRGEGLKPQCVCNDRRCMRARNPLRSKMLATLKEKTMNKYSTFEAIVAHLWRARTRAVFENPDDFSTVLFAVDIRSHSHCVEMVKEAVDRVTDDYVKSAIDWLEVYKGIPATCNGNFYISAWRKLPFDQLHPDFPKGDTWRASPIRTFSGRGTRHSQTSHPDDRHITSGRPTYPIRICCPDR